MKVIAIILSILIVVAAGCASLTVVQGEVFEGTASGYRGDITVGVRINNGSIVDIEILESMEDRLVGAAAIEELIDIVIENNSTDVDVISGATISSKGFLEAIQNAIGN